MFKKIVLLFLLLAPFYAQAADPIIPRVKVFDLSGKLSSEFDFFDPSYSGGVDFDLGDVNGDGLQEIVICSGSGYASIVKSYSAYGVEKDHLQAYADNFRGGCYVSVADLNGDKQDEVIVGAGFSGGPHIRAFEIGREVKSFFAFDKNLRNGTRVTARDLGNDGRSEIIAYSGVNASAEYAIFGNNGHKIADYKLSELNNNGLNLVVGDFNGDGVKEIAVAGGFGNKSEVMIFGKNNELLKKIIYHKTDYTGGLNLSAGDIDGDGIDEIIISESFNGSGDISAYNFKGENKLTFSAFSGNFFAGVKTAVGDVNGDGKNEVVAVPERVGNIPKTADYKYIAVDLSKQTLFRFQNGKLLDSFLISSGLTRTPTPVGEFTVTRKRARVHMMGIDYNLPNVPWVTTFLGPYTIHGTYWHKNFGHPMSHGCINMYTPDSKKVYDWSSIGTPVVIY